jgi:hypothetical protein
LLFLRPGHCPKSCFVPREFRINAAG